MQDASQFAMSHGLYNLNVGSEILILAGDIMSRSWPNIGGTKYCQEIHFGQKIALLLVDRKQPDSKSNQADFATTQPTVRQCVRCTWCSISLGHLKIPKKKKKKMVSCLRVIFPEHKLTQALEAQLIQTLLF